jgi:hypothetical protein
MLPQEERSTRDLSRATPGLMSGGQVQSVVHAADPDTFEARHASRVKPRSGPRPSGRPRRSRLNDIAGFLSQIRARTSGRRTRSCPGRDSRKPWKQLRDNVTGGNGGNLRYAPHVKRARLCPG